MQEPKIINLNLSENKVENIVEVELDLVFPKEAKYFQGHFPEVAILPGVLQVHFAVHFSKKYFTLMSNVLHIKKLRFARIICAEEDVKLRMKFFKERQKLFFQYSQELNSGTCNNSSGELYFEEEKQNV